MLLMALKCYCCDMISSEAPSGRVLVFQQNLVFHGMLSLQYGEDDERTVNLPYSMCLGGNEFIVDTENLSRPRSVTSHVATTVVLRSPQNARVARRKENILGCHGLLSFGQRRNRYSIALGGAPFIPRTNETKYELAPRRTESHANVFRHKEDRKPRLTEGGAPFLKYAACIVLSFGRCVFELVHTQTGFYVARQRETTPNLSTPTPIRLFGIYTCLPSRLTPTDRPTRPLELQCL